MTKHYDYRDYLAFYNNDFIKSIANNPKWSISDKDKRPINMSALETFLKERDTRVYIGGASQYDDTNMTTLGHTVKMLPNVANHAYMLNAKIDGWVVLDIEKTCPPDLKKKFLQIPYLYGEHSMSGKGIHLICRLPSNWNEFPNYQNMVKLQAKTGWYEILMYHWVTFTRNHLDKISSKGTKDGYTIADIFKDLTDQVKASQKTAIKELVDKPDIPSEKRVLKLMEPFQYSKKPEDFPKLDVNKNYLGPDMSRYEFGYASYLAYYVNQTINKLPSLAKKQYTDQEIEWMVYDLLKKRLKWRAKHDTKHKNMPWLLYNAVAAVEHMRLDEYNDKQEDQLDKKLKASKQKNNKKKTPKPTIVQNRGKGRRK